jgi:hypothetical protein
MLNLPPKDWQVLGTDLNCYESRWGVADLLLSCHPNDSTYDTPGETAALRDFSPLYVRFRSNSIDLVEATHPFMSAVPPNIDPKCNALVPVTLCHVCIPIAPEMRAEFARRHAYHPSPARRRCGGDCYSFTLMPASLINFAHCGISDLILAAKSGGVLATISMPRFCRCLRASFCARTRTVSL